jgi:hypothetical protein
LALQQKEKLVSGGFYFDRAEAKYNRLINLNAKHISVFFEWQI